MYNNTQSGRTSLENRSNLNIHALNNTVKTLNLIKQGNVTPQVKDVFFQTRYGFVPSKNFFTNSRKELGIIGFTNFVKWCKDNEKDDNSIQSYFYWGDSFVNEPSNTVLIQKMVILYKANGILPIHMFILTPNITNILQKINNSI